MTHLDPKEVATRILLDPQFITEMIQATNIDIDARIPLEVRSVFVNSLETFKYTFTNRFGDPPNTDNQWKDVFKFCRYYLQLSEYKSIQIANSGITIEQLLSFQSAQDLDAFLRSDYIHPFGRTDAEDIVRLIQEYNERRKLWREITSRMEQTNG